MRQSEVLEPMIDSEGLYTCGNFGCTKKFDINNNVEGDCHYHAGAPGFRDVCKYWTCCNV